MSAPFDLVVRNAHLVRCSGEGTASERLAELPAGALGVRGGALAYVGPDAELEAAGAVGAAETIDAEGQAVLPGFIDPHTHLVFAGSRAGEFARRMNGEDYRTIAAAGGGIAATVRATREASDQELLSLARERARGLRRLGVTAVEVKSGYGLTPDDERRCLRVARDLETEGWLRVTTSYLGAHTVPPERRDDRDSYVDEVVSTLPSLHGLADACDVYLDDGAFSRDEAARILGEAKRLGFHVRGHVGQFADLRGAELLAELGALSADHLEEVSDAGLAQMHRAGVVAVLLPGAWRTLRQEAPSAARLREAGVSMAVGTDCNPGTSPTVDLPACAALAVRDAGLTPEEAILALTVHAAQAAGFAAERGTLETGKAADFLLLPTSDPRALGYVLGGLTPSWVVHRGEVVEKLESAVRW